MREIKFRAFDKRFSVMLNDIMPYQPSIVLSDVTFNNCYGDKADDRSEIGVDDGGPEHYCITDEQIEIMQFTGLKDKNGVEIYEGDIIQIFSFENPYRIASVVFDEYSAMWKVLPIEGQFIDIGYFWYCINSEHRSSEVIGNIHQHPELLTPKS